MAINPKMEHLAERKLELLREVLGLTQEALLLVDLEDLGPFWSKKTEPLPQSPGWIRKWLHWVSGPARCTLR